MATARGTKRSAAPKSDPAEPARRAARRAPSGLALRSGAPAIQASLEVNRPGDSFERQAEAVAERVMRSPAPPERERAAQSPRQLQRATAPEQEEVARAQSPRQLQRAASPEQEEVARAQSPRQLQRAAAPEQEEVARAQDMRAVQRSGGGEPPRVSASAAAAIRSPGPGQPLSPAMRGRIEPQLGSDLSHVRVHSDAGASRAAGSLRATAFTHQNHIFLRKPASSGDLRLMAHESTHVVQQGAAVQRSPLAAGAPEIQRLPAIVADRLNEYARYIPGYTLFTVIAGFNPITGADVPRTPMNLVEGLLGLTPFGTIIFDKLRELGILQEAFDWISAELERFDLSLSRLERMIDEAYEEMDFIRLDIFDFNLGVLTRKFSQLLSDVTGFAGSLVSKIVDLIKEAAIGLAESALAENKAWALIKKVIQYDPLRDEEVSATPVEILEDFLMLIGKEQELAQMRERGTLQETADWIATQVGQFLGLLSTLGGLIDQAWGAIQPENLASLGDNITSLAASVGSFLQQVWDFAITVAAKVLELVKKALLGWLSSFAHELPGFHLVTVILGRNPFTGEVVPRSAENIIRGFITLLPGGQQKYDELQQTGTISEAAARIEGAMADLGISWEMITGLFLGIWEGLTIDDLIDPVGAFQRIVDQFGEPISRLFAFIGVVIREIFSLILALMNFPSDILARIIDNAMQAIEDIKRDPAAFFNNMLSAVKLGFTHFFDNILQHLLSGLTDWLFGQLRKAGIEPPADLSLGSILDMVLTVLGISMERIWEKLGERIGPERVAQIRGAIDRLTGIWTFVRDVQERGVAAIWEYIASQISNLWNMVLEQAKAWIMREVIERVVGKLLSMLDPTGIMAVVNSFIAFFNAVQSAIEYFREILLIVDDYVSTIAAVAQGNVEPGAQKMEGGLASAIPIAIGFLANQVGLGNLAEKLAEIIAGLRELIDQALTWLIDRAVSLGESALSALGLRQSPEEATAGDALPGITEGFRSTSGEGHTLQIDAGEHEELIVRSRPLSYSQFLAGIDPGGDAAKAAAKLAAQTIVSEFYAIRNEPYPPGISPAERQTRLQDKRQRMDAKLAELWVQTNILLGAQGNVPTGASQQEAIPITWYKPLSNANLYPAIDLLDDRGQRTTIAVSDGVHQFRHPLAPGLRITVGVNRGSYEVSERTSPFMRLPESRGTMTNQQRYLLNLLDARLHGMPLDTAGVDMDHVRDLGFGGADVPENIWPFDRSANRSAGSRQNAQIVTYQDVATNQVRAVAAGHLSLIGKFFKIEKVEI